MPSHRMAKKLLLDLCSQALAIFEGKLGGLIGSRACICHIFVGMRCVAFFLLGRRLRGRGRVGDLVVQKRSGIRLL